jgi:hypothetical protein
MPGGRPLLRGSGLVCYDKVYEPEHIAKTTPSECQTSASGQLEAANIQSVPCLLRDTEKNKEPVAFQGNRGRHIR